MMGAKRWEVVGNTTFIILTTQTVNLWLDDLVKTRFGENFLFGGKYNIDSCHCNNVKSNTPYSRGEQVNEVTVHSCPHIAQPRNLGGSRSAIEEEWPRRKREFRQKRVQPPKWSLEGS